MNYDAVFHIDSFDGALLNFILNNITNFYNALPDEAFRVVLVANGPAVRLFERRAPAAERLAGLMAKGLSVRLCRNALTAFSVDEGSLQEGLDIVPAGIAELVRLQKEGFAYIKP